ncbi:MAG: molecular chaperone DnaJ [Lactobacillus sp.]|jgi:molecular chaperone DnaJ|nr:molecular chaperone DnaJ [Lactobacillus sp.]
MSTKLDYYKVLEVERTATGEEIKKSFRRLAMKFHPDKNPGDKECEEKFKYMCEAYEVLKDEQKRAAYDRYGHDAFAQGGGFGSGGNPFGGFEFNFGSGGFSSIFEDIFSEFMGGGPRRGGGSGRASYAKHGEDLRYDIKITLEEAYSGTEKEIKYKSTSACEKCHGHGTKDGKEPPVCQHCNGTGQTRRQQGPFIMQAQCPNCGGKGRAVKDPCPECSGHGEISRDRNLKIKIPAGIEHATRMRISGEGEAGLRGGQNGDLYVFVTVKNHKIYDREGANLFTEVPISFAKAALGGTITLPSIDGEEIEVKIEEGSQYGKQIRVKNHGMNVLNSTRKGDLYVSLKVETPVKLTERQKEILGEFEQISAENHPEQKGFFEKIKELFSKAS